MEIPEETLENDNFRIFISRYIGCRCEKLPNLNIKRQKNELMQT